MATKFAGKAAGKREKRDACIGTSERKQARRGFLGNGLSRTAMVFKIALVAGHKLTVPELNKIKDVNPRSLERVYDQIIGGGYFRRRAVCAETDIEIDHELSD